MAGSPALVALASQEDGLNTFTRELDAELVQARLRLHANGAPASIAIAAACGLVLAVLLRAHLGVPALLAWLATLAAVLAWRGWVWLRAPGPVLVSASAALRRYRLATALHGTVWAAFVLAVGWRLPPEPLELLFLVGGALIGGSLVSMAFDRVAALCFALPLLAALLLRCTGLGAPALPEKAALLIAFVGVTGVAAERMARAMRGLMRAQRDASARAAEADEARAELAEQHHLLAQLVRTTTQGFWRLDPDGRTVEANEAMCRLLGRTRAELMGRYAFDLFAPEDAAIREQALEQRRRGVAASYEVRLVMPDGSLKLAHNSASPLFDTAGRFAGSVGLWTDLSERGRQEQALATLAEDLRRTLEATGDAIFASDVRDAQAPVRFANRQMLNMWGVAGATELTLTPAQVMAAAMALFREPEQERQIVRDVLRHNRDDERRLHLRDGRVILRRSRPAEGTEGTIRVWTFRDVTAEARAEQALRASEAHLRALLEAFPGYISALDDELRYTFVNQRFAALMGRPAEALIGRPVPEVVGEEAFAPWRREIERAAAGEIVQATRHVPAADGRPRLDLEVTRVAGPVQPDGRRVFYAFGSDVTARKLAEEALVAARDEAERANRAKSQFLAQMSHELRTPLNAVIGFAQLMQSDPERAPGERARAQLGEIIGAGRHLLDIINELLDLARIEAGHLVPEAVAVPLAPLLEECLSLAQPLAQQRGLSLAPAPALPPGTALRGDRVRVKQVLLNLLANAVKYNRPGGWVRLGCEAGPERIRIEVHDGGHGLDAAQRARLFEPFERLGAAAGGVEGTGIGLALSRRIVHAMGGAIGVDSEPGVGSCFWFELAAAHAAAQAEDEAGGDAEVSGSAGAPRRVFYIEDNKVNIALMEAMLARERGLELSCFEQPGLGLAQALAEPPDLLLLDIQMPGMDGFEVYRRLREQAATRQLPVVGVSADATPARIDAALALGFAAYLTKPLDLALLLETVRRLLAPARRTARD